MLVKKPLVRKPVVTAPPAEPMPDNTPFPVYVPMHPAFNTKSKVYTSSAHRDKKLDGATFDVNLLAGTCNCPIGKPWQWHVMHGKWVRNFSCSHKIRAMADIVDKSGRPPDIMIAYSKEVASRYNKYEVVSAFHKELRRGAIEQAMFWGSVLANFRAVGGVIKYMLNILYEETRDHQLGWDLIAALEIKDAGEKYEAMMRCVVLFCASKKKWELSHRMQYLEYEMRAYSLLVSKYGREVAKGGDIIPLKEKNGLLASLKTGIKNKDYKLAQYGLKGLQKTVHADINSARAAIINEITNPSPKVTGLDKMVEFISKRAEKKYGIGYHELNAFVDLLCGEPYGAGLLPAAKRAELLSKPVPALRIGVAPSIPTYAHDNHTYTGKALIRRYPAEYQPGAVQEHYDLRLCGAYMGVAWRHLAYKQHKAIDCTWADVAWPDWLHETVSNLWY